MRIPSQFNQDNLYRRRNRQPDSAQSIRRIIRLSVVLALVVVVMRQASKPAVYEPFFGSQVVPVDQRSSDSEIEPVATPLAAASIDPSDRRIAAAVVSAISVDQHPFWLHAFTRSDSPAVPADRSTATVERMVDQLKSIRATDDQRRSWEATLGLLSLPESNWTDPHRARITAMVQALDAAAAARVVDGSVWSAQDFDAFYRYLDQAALLPSKGIAVTGVLPLLQQPKVFLNQLVRVQGSIARADWVDAQDNVYGIQGYWQLWLRPADGADRPVVVITPDLPESVRGWITTASSQGFDTDDGAQFAFVGRYLKRLAYQSTLGADLTPVVVGRIVAVPLPQTATSAPVASRPQAGGLWLVLLVTSVLGIGLATLLMWRSSIAARRTRQLRRSQQQSPASFLDTLGPAVGNSSTREQQ